MKKYKFMKRALILLCGLLISEWSMSQNAGGMINRPQKNRKNNKSETIVAKKQSDNRAVNSFTKYDNVKNFDEGLAAVKLNNKWGFIDKTGREVILRKYDFARDFSEGMACVELNNKWGFIDKTGREVIPCIYDGVYAFNEGLAEVKLNNKIGFIDKSGDIKIPCKYEYINNQNFHYCFKDGFALISLNGKYGFINKNILSIDNQLLIQ